ncbi:hypothetical protein LCGC14_0490940 [marine sediment metagenome]|uniref:Uncharacterized protein n=1 Tax=marine sediment metagenome TaxID=412755 RepID=A0A0F9UTG5_9ZZZZ
MLELSTRTDISRFNNSRPADDTIRPIDFQRMVDQGVDGVCVRKSIGRFHDPAFEMNWQGAGDAGLRRTVYSVPYIRFDIGPQQLVMSTWPSGGVFDGRVDDPAWADIERKHDLPLSVAIARTLDFMYSMKDTFGECEVYTGKYVWQDFYSRRPGWHKDWALVIAQYRKDLYLKGVAAAKDMVANQVIHPNVPEGWLRDRTGNTIPSELRWEQWQIFADGDNLGNEYGCPSRDIDISFRQGKLLPPPPPDDSALEDLVVSLREAWGVAGDVLTEIEEEVSV